MFVQMVSLMPIDAEKMEALGLDWDAMATEAAQELANEFIE